MHLYYSGHQDTLPGEVFSELGNYRHKIFVDRLGWDLVTDNGQEIDQFDRADTIYVVAKNNAGRILGCARLLPTTRPYLLGEVFPELLNGLPPPSSPDVWELSRFAAVDIEDPQAGNQPRLGISISVALLKETMRRAKELGAKRLITVTTIGVERLVRRTGVNSHRAGPPKIVDGFPLTACWIEL